MAENGKKISTMDLLCQIQSEMLVPIRVEIGIDALHVFTTVKKGSSQEEDALVIMKQLCEDLCSKGIPHEPREREVDGRNRIDCIAIHYKDMEKA